MDPLSLLEFGALLFLPGLALFQLLGLRGSSIIDNLAVSLGLGVSTSAILLIVRTSGFTVDGTTLNGIYPGTVDLIVGASAAVLAVGIAFRKKVCFYAKPSRSDFAVLLMLAVQFALVVAHFAEYPVFPEFSSVDFTQHVAISAALQSGAIASLPGGILYYGAHTLMAALIALSSDPSLIATQLAMSVLVVLSPLLVYSATKALSDSERIGLVATAVYVLGGFVWFGSVFNAGLYSNFYGLLASLFLVVAASVVLKEPGRPASWVVYIVATANVYFSHYSTLTILPALVLLPILGLVINRKVDKVLLGLALIPVVPMVAVAAAYPSLVGTLLNFISASGGANILGDTPLSSAFAWFPFLRYVFIEITSDTASVLILLMAALGAFFTLRQRKPLAWLPLVWLVSIAVAAPFSETAWRFSYVALVPLVIVASMGFSFILPKTSATAAVKRRGRNPATQRRNHLILASALLILMVAGSWGTKVVEDAATSAQLNGQAQHDVYDSMIWFADNTPADSKLVSVTDSRYSYLGLLTGRSSAYAPLLTPAGLLPQVSGQKDVYVALTRLATLSVSGTQGSELLSLYSGNSNFTLVYNNTDVRIYAVRAGG